MIRVLAVLAALLACASCVTHVFRHAEPARVERVGLDAVWIAASAAGAVLLLPFGSYQLFAPEPVD